MERFDSIIKQCITNESQTKGNDLILVFPEFIASAFLDNDVILAAHFGQISNLFEKFLTFSIKDTLMIVYVAEILKMRLKIANHQFAAFCLVLL